MVREIGPGVHLDAKFEYIFLGEPPVGNLGILAGQHTLVANLGKIVHEHVRMADSFILVCERPLVVNFGRLTRDYPPPLVPNLSR